MQKLQINCVDINTEYCPCLLAETNHCVFCSQLKGEVVCACQWSGLCVLYEKHWKIPKTFHPYEEIIVRKQVETEFTILEQLTPDIYRIELEITPELKAQLTPLGSFVFLRCPEDPDFYHFPVGVMKVAENRIQVVIDALGPKSKKIFAADNKKILVRGPYYNGILGKPWIDHMNHGKIILIVGGMGQPPALPIAEELVKKQNEVIAVTAPGKVGKVFIEQELQDLGIKTHRVASMRKNGLTLLHDLLDLEPDLLVSAGPDEQHYGVMAALQTTGFNIPMAVTNNATMCCGEGICGSCRKTLQNQQKVPICKVQTDFMALAID